MESFFQCLASGQRPVADVLAGFYSVAVGAAGILSIRRRGAHVELEPYVSQLRKTAS